MYTTERIVKDEFILSYRYYRGEREETLVAFHGFGQTNILFETFIPSVLSYYSVVAIDLFFHGESSVKESGKHYLSVEGWNELFSQLLEKHHIDRFSLLSYSMGSRFVVRLLNMYASRINKIALIAPDGFGNNFWFNVATSTYLTRFVFEYSMWHPMWIQLMVRVLGSVGIFNAITKRFIERNLESDELRKRIYASWVYFRKLTILKSDFVEGVNKNKIRFICFCGKEDQLVARKSMELLCTQTGATYVELDLAHHKMIQALDRSELLEFLVSDRK